MTGAAAPRRARRLVRHYRRTLRPTESVVHSILHGAPTLPLSAGLGLRLPTSSADPAMTPCAIRRRTYFEVSRQAVGQR